MDSSRIQILTICVAALLLVGVLELVRRRRLLERYALLWLLSSVVLLSLAVWRGALDQLAAQIGVAYPPNALFIVAFGFVLWLLLHFSVAVSRLNDQSKVLAQRLAILEERIRRAEGDLGGEAFDVGVRDDEEQPELAEVWVADRPRRPARTGKR
ncbi:MAG TPA: DUF2304 domain-containing protein [Solirubrobacteraceae bacterium]|nr:DUF2304 domain-containing protein [Solirubrobacteraceae bacterium]